MSHDHEHDHHHGEHGHTHHHGGTAGVEGTWADPDADDPLSVSRRGFLATAAVVAGAAAGIGATASGLGQGVAAAAGTDAAAGTSVNPWTPGARYLSGDHHIHTKYSPDAQYEVQEQIRRGRQYGLDWMVITDHGGVAHQKLSIDKITPEIAQARKVFSDTLIYQGLEWNIPNAEHATVMLPPGNSTVDILKAFEAGYDGSVLSANGVTGNVEPYALEALKYLDNQVRNKRTEIALMFANHPSRQGIDSPHEIRNWRDAAPSVAVGMEGAPGHQAAGIPISQGGPGSGRGYYDNAGTNSARFAPYPPESYRTFGGFDWMTATVGGLWDSLLAEGKPWWVTSTSDSHRVFRDTRVQGPLDFNTNGTKGPAVDTGRPITEYGDFWPGQYSNTMVMAGQRSYVDVMRGLQAGKIVAVHGRLIEGLDVRVRSAGQGDAQGVTLGGRTWVRRGGDITVTITVKVAGGANANGDVPKLAKIDVITGPVTGPQADRDVFTAPETAVAKTFEVGTGRAQWTFEHTFTNVDRSFYLRLRGSDGKQLDANGNPPIDIIGDANPWEDLWFYANPIFVDAI